jgi:hypothetical protein
MSKKWNIHIRQQPGLKTLAADGLTSSSLDDVIGSEQQRPRDRQAQRLGSLEVDDQLELGRLLYRKIAGSGAFEDLVDIASCASGARRARRIALQAVVRWHKPS